MTTILVGWFVFNLWLFFGGSVSNPKTIQHGGDGSGFSEMPLEGPSDPGSVSPARFDFGGDNTNDKCVVRDTVGECPSKAEFRIVQNQHTTRDVCGDCLAEAVDFVTQRTNGVFVTRLGG